MKGRKPTPTAIKKLRGTDRPDRGVRNEARFPIPGRMLSPPKNLGEDGEELWRNLGKLLLDAGLLTYGDTLALEMLCIAYDRMCRANREVEKETEVLMSDKGNYYQNPWLSIANKAWDQCKAMLAEFGLTPAERTRVMALVEEEKRTLADELFRVVEEARKEAEKAAKKKADAEVESDA